MKRLILLFACFFLTVCLVPEAAAQLRRAERALENGDIEGALSVVQTRLEEKPDDYRAYISWANIHRAQAKESDGEEQVTHWAMVAANLRKALELRPQAEAVVMQALLIDYQQTFMGGVDFYNEALQTEEEDAAQQLFGGAAQQFAAAAAVMPDSLDPYVNWAVAVIQSGVPAGAIEPFEQAISISQERGIDEEEWYDRLGRLYIQSERYQDAVTLLEAGAERFAESESLQQLLLAAYAEAGQNDRAIARYRERAELLPGDRITRYNLGSLLLQAEQYDEAIVHLRAATEIDDYHTDSFYNLGAAYVNKAVDLQREIRMLDDTLRATKDSLTEDEAAARQEEIDDLNQQKMDIFEQSIAPLEHAKELAETAGADASAMCRALYQAYAQLNMMEKVEEVTSCAGF